MTDTDLITSPALDTAGAAPRRRGGLTGMVLADLRGLAAEIGIGDTAGMRKGDLIIAIKQRQAGSNGAATKDVAPKAAVSNGAVPNGAVPNGAVATRAPQKHTATVPPVDDGKQSAAPETTAPQPTATGPTREPSEGQSDARRSRQRRGSARAAGAPPTDTEVDRATTAPAGGTSQDSAEPKESGEQPPKTEGEAQQPAHTERPPREQSDRQQGGRNNRQGNNNQASSNNNQASNTGPQSQRQERAGLEDDGDGRGRRGRRFRERRRGRDRGPEQGTTPNDRDLEVREDDVLQPVAGILDVLDNYAFVRTSGYLAGPNDVYVSMSLVRKNGLRRGDAVTGAVRIAREGEQSNSRQKFNPLVRIDTINGGDAEAARKRPEFNKLTPLYPNQRLRLETTPQAMTARIIDLVMPIGKGQRALIVSPPKAGKTSVLQAIANAISVNNPECHLMVVLVDERPEEVTDMQRSVKGEVISSTFDRPPGDHTAVAELAIERAKRLVESGTDVVVLLDSITRLGRAYNNSSPASGRILSGGVDSTALYPPKRFLGAARNIEFGGSLTIIATAMVETGSTGDTVIFEEFKGTGNAELKLDRKIAERRVFPAVDVNPSGTRKDELLMAPDEYKVALKLRRVLSGLDSHQAIDLLTSKLRKSGSNAEFLMEVARTAPGAAEEHQRET